MNRDAFDELAHAALEGAATAEQRAELDTRIGQDPELRERWESLSETFRELALVRPEPAPAGLRNDVMRVIRAERAAGRGAERSSWLARAFGLRLASAFAAGCAAGVLVVSMVGGHRLNVDGRSTSGTMLPSGAAPRASAALAVHAIHAALDVRGDAMAFEARVTARGDGDGTIVLDHGPSLAPGAVETSQSRPRRISFAQGQETLEFSGNLECTIRFHGAAAGPTALRVTLRSGTEAVQKELRIPPASRAE